MILAIDVGNTNVSLAIVEAGAVKKTWNVKTQLPQQRFKNEFQKVIRRVQSVSPSLKAVVVCSVVPPVMGSVKSILKKVLSLKPLVIGENIFTPIKNLYRKPKQVGQDRLVCAYAARELYGAPTIIVDFGTAITFDVVSAKGEYLGGAIVPGLRLYVESLFEKTALLPKVDITKPRDVIGRDTKESILSGIFYGYGALYDGMIRMMSQGLKQKPVVIVTGGYTKLTKSFLKNPDHIDRSLIFKGIELTYWNYRVQR